jgi:putative nucleotidyltransferase-like protein
VEGSDLAARVESADQLEAALEIVDASQAVLPPLGLLKGLSLCAQEYPEPHLRPMRDLDLLVDHAGVAALEGVLERLGYGREATAQSYAGHHHTTPFVHPRTKVWVEVHHGLFPPASALGSDPLFAPERVREQLHDSTLHGRPVRRLGVEMQVVYLCAHWASSSKLLGGRGGLLPLLDLVYLLRSHAVRWPVLLAWLVGSAAAPGVYALLAYGARRGVLSLPPEVLEGVRQRQRAFDAVTLALAFALVDRCMAEGRRRLPVVGRTGLGVLWKALFLPGPPLRNFSRVPALWRAARAADQGPVR